MLNVLIAECPKPIVCEANFSFISLKSVRGPFIIVSDLKMLCRIFFKINELLKKNKKYVYFNIR